MTTNPRIAFFDGIAVKWDGWEELEALGHKLAAGLDELGVGVNECVLDVGCGTGNLTLALLARLSDRGRVVAVDIAQRMIDVARVKIADERVVWHTVDARRLPLEDGSCDRVICCSVWPHFEDPGEVAAELSRVLRPGGLLHVWHLIQRERVNAIHASADEAVRGDVLAPARETAKLLAGAGFLISTAVETAERYLVTARKAMR
ncbi:MAG TPA: class I SAM-dependent methyltransferase [Polyangia bacterium]|nr:class I SAM-dependent methyltransferase [Polyangia bacterium]